MAAGCPREAFTYYPSDHAGAGEIVRRCGRSMFFGDVSAVGAFAGDPRIELHGPGYSKVLLGPDRVDAWREHLDLMVRSIADNGGRSCVNASGVWVPSRGREIAEALAERVVTIEPLPADHPDALLAPFLDRRVAEWIDEQIETGLREPGAIDVTAGAAAVSPAGRIRRVHAICFRRSSTATAPRTPSRTASSCSRSRPSWSSMPRTCRECRSRSGPRWRCRR